MKIYPLWFWRSLEIAETVLLLHNWFVSVLCVCEGHQFPSREVQLGSSCNSQPLPQLSASGLLNLEAARAVSVVMPHVQMCCFGMQRSYLERPTLQTALGFLEGEALFSTSLLGCIKSPLNSVKTWYLVCLPISRYYQTPKEIHNVAHKKEMMFQHYVKIAFVPLIWDVLWVPKKVFWHLK